ncbi:hypothetical protein CN189_21475 [Sinorhizobium meliloti]|nr:hypothetical protein CN189_21475 [Sinorhizobium meliloti]
MAEIAAEFGNCALAPRKTNDASNIISRSQPGTCALQRIKIVGIDLDGIDAFRRKIIVLRRISSQGNWIKSKTSCCLNIS